MGRTFWSIIYSTVLWASIQHHNTTLSNLKMGHRKRNWPSHLPGSPIIRRCQPLAGKSVNLIWYFVVLWSTIRQYATLRSAADAIIHNQDLCTHNLHLTIELRFNLINMISTHHNISRNRKAVVSRTLRFLYTDAIWTVSDPVPMPKKIITWSNST